MRPPEDSEVHDGERRPLPPATEEALERLWNATSTRLFGYFVRLGVPEDHADDLVQEVFAVILAQYHRFDGKDDAAWAFTIARYELLTWRSGLRRAAPRQAELGDDIPVDPEAEARLAEMELLAAHEAFRSTLDPVATLLFDHLGSDLSDADLLELIASKGGGRLTLGALRGRRMRTREAFAACLRAKGLR